MDRVRLVVEEIKVKLAISRSKLLLLQEQRVVHERERIEDVKAEAVGQDQCVTHECVQARLEGGRIHGCGQACLGGVVEEIGCADRLVLGRPDDR